MGILVILLYRHRFYDLNHAEDELILLGNNYSADLIAAGYESFIGAILQNDGKGNFKFIPPSVKWFFVVEDAKSIVAVKNENGKVLFG